MIELGEREREICFFVMKMVAIRKMSVLKCTLSVLEYVKPERIILLLHIGFK